MSQKSRAAFQRAGVHLKRGIARTLYGICDLAVGLFDSGRGTCIVLCERLAQRRRTRGA